MTLIKMKYRIIYWEDEEDPYNDDQVDRWDIYRPSSSYSHNQDRPTVYNEDYIKKVWGSDTSEASHRPFDKDDGPPIVDRDYVDRPPSYDDERFNGYFNNIKGNEHGFTSNRRPGNQGSERRPSLGDRNDGWNRRPGYDDRDEDKQGWNRRPGYDDRDEDRNRPGYYDKRRPDYGDRDWSPSYDYEDRDRRPGYDYDDRDRRPGYDRDQHQDDQRRRDPDGYFTDTTKLDSAIRDRYSSDAEHRDKYFKPEEFFQKRHSLEARGSHLSYGK